MLLFKSHLKLPLIDTFSTECLVIFREWARDKISKCRGSSQTTVVNSQCIMTIMTHIKFT